MTLPPGAYIENGWVVYNDQAYTPKEWEQRGNRAHRRGRSRQELREYKREWMRQRRLDPEYVEREHVAQRRYANRNRPRVVGSLHGLACSGPTKVTGCRCHKIVCWDRQKLRLVA